MIDDIIVMMRICMYIYVCCTAGLKTHVRYEFTVSNWHLVERCPEQPTTVQTAAELERIKFYMYPYFIGNWNNLVYVSAFGTYIVDEQTEAEEARACIGDHHGCG